MKQDIKLSPSKISQFFKHDCDRYLIYTGIDDKSKKLYGWPIENRTRTSSSKAGDDWEEQALKVLGFSVHTKPIPGTTSYESFDVSETIKLLQAPPKEYLYQLTLTATDSFIKNYLAKYLGSNAGFVSFGMTHPDLVRVEIDGTRFKFSVIDLKLAKRPKIEHKIQIAIYARLLESIILDNGINGYVDLDNGYVWSAGKVLPTKFELGEVLSFLDEFLATRLPNIVADVISCPNPSDIHDTLDYNIGQMCEWCGNFECCITKCEGASKIELMPYLSKYAQKYLKTLGIPDDISGFRTYCSTAAGKTTLLASISWKRRMQEVNDLLDALMDKKTGTNTIRHRKTASMEMPCNETVQIILTAQKDESADRVYTYGIRMQTGKNVDLFGKGLNANGYAEPIKKIIIAAENTSNEFNKCDEQFVKELHDLLSKVDQYNQCTTISKYLLLQGYVMDNYELKNIEEIMYTMLQRGKMINEVLDILFWIQGETMITEADAQPETCVQFPVIVLTSLISKLFVLPAYIAYNLETLSKQFSPMYSIEYKYNRKYCHPLSNAMTSDEINEYWNSKTPTIYSGIISHIEKRLDIECNIISGIRKQKHQGVSSQTWPIKFRLISRINYKDKDISKLYFETLYENQLQYHRIRQPRMMDFNEVVEDGKILKLKFIRNSKKRDYFEVINGDKYSGDGWFCATLFEDTPLAKMQMIGLQDIKYIKLPFNTISELFDVSYGEVERISGKVYYSIDELKGLILDKYKTYYLFERYRDYNTKKIIGGLNILETRTELLHPEHLAGPNGCNYIVDGAELKKARSTLVDDFSVSQEKAFQYVYENKLTLVLGPPGTGKTDFIARAILTLCRFYSNQGKNMRVLISGQSHSAIENALVKLQSMMGSVNDIYLYKVDRFDDGATTDKGNMKILSKKHVKNLWSIIQDKPCVVGATNWGIYEALKESRECTFDLVILDEASQIRTMDAMLALECGNSKTSRYMIVGDEDQLPPIIQGTYESDNAIYLFGSVFRLYLDTCIEKKLDYAMQLNENFRMNDILVRYSAEKIYGSNYKAFNAAIGTQIMALSTISPSSYVPSYILKMIEPEWPLVVCVLSGGTPKELRDTEVQIVANLTNELRKYMLNPSTAKQYNMDNEFWGNSTEEGGFGIISPHHEQINLIKDGIVHTTGMNRDDLYVGTVDKLQGKQRQSIIVSYGITDIEQALGESEFVFSRNRLNVSITRGKKKTIVFLSEVLIEKPLEALGYEDEEIIAGIDFMSGLKKFMQKTEVDTTNDSDIVPISGSIKINILRKRII